MSSYAAALGLTLVIEGPIYAVALTRFAGRRLHEAVATGLGVNLISHPIAFLVIYPVVKRPAGGAIALGVVEIAVALAEAAMLSRRRVPLDVALATSGCANITSLVIGAVVRG